MRYSTLAALPLLVSVPASAQAPSGDPWTRTETRADAEAMTTALHARLDLNHDGYVTADEIDQWAKQQTGATGQVGPRAEGVVRRFFDKGDSNHDGRLSLAEALAGTDASFAEMDTNHDGKVTPDERRAAMMRMVNAMVPPSKPTH
jgi:Ca2+-binding EF-hand superfamily protein